MQPVVDRLEVCRQQLVEAVTGVNTKDNWLQSSSVNRVLEQLQAEGAIADYIFHGGEDDDDVITVHLLLSRSVVTHTLLISTTNYYHPNSNV